MDQHRIDTEASAGVTASIEGGVAVVTLNKADRRNVLDEEMVSGLHAAFERLEADASVRVVVLTGAGTAFCAGAHLDTLLGAAQGGFDRVKGVYDGFLRVLHSPLPTIAAVNGPAVGAGFNLALACDVRLASQTAVFASRFLELRLHPGGGHSWLLERAVGRQRAMAMTLFGQSLDAQQAYATGLVLDVLAPDLLIAAARELAAGVVEMEPELVRAAVATLRAAEQEPRHDKVLEIETARQQWSTTRPDFVRRTRELQARIARRRR